MGESRTWTYILTVVHNRKPITAAFAESLRKQTEQNFTLVVVDDGSTDGTADAVRAILPSAVILRGDGNLWWAGGLQKGLNWLAAQNLVDGSAIAFMNDDIGFGPEYLARALAELRVLGRGAFLTVPGVFQPSGRRCEEAVVSDWTRFTFVPYGAHPERIDCTTTRTLFSFWGDLARVGGFHPTLLPHYTSDWEFTIRAHRKGISLVPSQTVVAEFNDLTTGEHRTSHLRFKEKWKRLFSVRFSFNLPTMFLFIWYACPWWAKIPCWARVVMSGIKFLK